MMMTKGSEMSFIVHETVVRRTPLRNGYGNLFCVSSTRLKSGVNEKKRFTESQLCSVAVSIQS